MKGMKRLTACGLSFALIFSMTAYGIPAPAAEPEDTAQEIVIYHTNDTHGYLQGNGSSAIGIDQVAGLKESTPGAILVDAGDATQGLPLASLTKGGDVIGLMNLAGYDLMTAGNHEFDFGTGQFLSNVALADFPVLAANIYRNNQLLLAGVQEGNNGCHTVIERDGVKIGFFGLTTADTATSTNPAGISDLEFRDEVETAQQEITALEAEGADVIVAVCHLGDSEGGASCTSEDLADAMPEGAVDVIIDGHSHTIENKEVNGTLIVQTGTGMSAVGKLTLQVEEGTDGYEVTATEELLDAAALADVAPDAEVTAKLAEISASQSELLGEGIGNAETTLWAGNVGMVAIARVVETNYGDYVADAFRSAGEEFMETVGGEDADLPVIAVENAGGIRAAAPNGEITVGDLINAFPYSNTLYMKKVTPQILYQAMEVSGRYLDGQDKETGMLLQAANGGGFLQISGFTVVYDPYGEEGARVTSITLDGQSEPLDRNDSTTEIMMVSNNYIMNGGSDYDMLGQLPGYGEAGGELETIQSYLESCLVDGTLQGYAGTRNRIQMRSQGYEPGDYTAFIQIVDEEGNPLAGKELSYRVDGGARQNGITDENGMLYITVSDGGHGVRLADNQQEVYIDNYTGFGIYEDVYRTVPQLTFLADGSCDPIEEQPEDPSDTEEPSGTEDSSDTQDPSDTEELSGTQDPSEPQNPSGTDNASGTTQVNSDAPQTGDTSGAGVTVVLLAGAAAVFLAAIQRRRIRK